MTRRYQVVLAGISARTIPAVDRAYDALGGFRDDDLPVFVDATSAVTDAAKRAALAVATAYLATVLGVPPPSITVDELPVAFNAQSSFLAVRKALSDGHTYSDAVVIGKSQAQAAVRNLTISTARTAGDVFDAKSSARITGWERNAESGACPWCRNLDGVVFNTSTAGDFGHDRCHCTVSPLAA